MPDRKRDDRLITKPDEETSRLADTGTPEPDDSYQSREGYHDLGGGFLPDPGEPNDEPEITEEGE